MQLLVPSSAHRWHRCAFWYCSPLAITSSLLCNKFWWNITGIWLYSAYFCKYICIWPDSNVHLQSNVLIWTFTTGNSAGSAGGGCTCPGFKGFISIMYCTINTISWSPGTSLRSNDYWYFISIFLLVIDRKSITENHPGVFSTNNNVI
jgi:hypothetical protein